MRRQPFLGPDGAFTALLSLLVVLGSLGVTLLLVFTQVRRVARASPVTGQGARALVLGFRLTGGAPCAVYQARLLRAARLAADDPRMVLVLLGGVTDGNTVSEAAAGRDFLSAHGVATSRVVVEEASRHTLENLRAYREGFAPAPTPDLLVTSRAHLARGLAMAEGLGLRLVPCAAEDAPRVPFVALLREAVLLHWYQVGSVFAHATNNRHMLARIR
ncbi:YdcF family protein [Plastoroseomonas arctica]|uniref:YdcF family protein n=1 Tax=Plastoroseomonas arctica TaxID=1509237 RepID=A0AAF1KMZ7_9PROT|nr:YdcF family protein [Plastoroseomonas arctica]MBR0656996.1 YdcF family protein [Plastoroseomonas arctica]